MTDETATQASMTDAATAEAVAAPAPVEDHDTRARVLVEAYSHGLDSNSPRTLAELRELRALLLGD